MLANAGQFTCAGSNRDSSTHQQRQLHEAHLGTGTDDELLAERIGLLVVDEDKKAVAVECVDRMIELLFPVDLPVSLDRRQA
ncbi:MAG TPA: hypothetical protein VF306_03565 [Pirellulales bacterium]